MVDYVIPKVHRVVDGPRSYIVPEWNDMWTTLEKLRWHAAVTCLDANLRGDSIKIESARPTNEIVGDRRNRTFTVHTKTGSFGNCSYGETWAAINGIALGLRIEKEYRDHVPDSQGLVFN